MRGVFERYDADGDGSLSGVEMRNMLRDVGLVSAFDTAEDCAFLKKQLIAADRDGDGAVGDGAREQPTPDARKRRRCWTPA